MLSSWVDAYESDKCSSCISRSENLMVILYIGATTSGSSSDPLYRELWHACAGPLVLRQGERVYYFHMDIWNRYISSAWVFAFLDGQ
uniref:Uncharacterized protein n=1 Tax=Aegilops tauschii subsp. strangulata TaxID=200361 RepID=A0A452XFY3_AEGTS